MQPDVRMKHALFGYVTKATTLFFDDSGRSWTNRRSKRAGSVPVSTVRDNGQAIEVQFRNGSVRRFDRVVLTIPCSRIAEACPQLTTGEKERLRGVVYQGMVCGSMLVGRPLNGFYVTNIQTTGSPSQG